MPRTLKTIQDPTKLTDEELRKLHRELKQKQWNKDPVQWAVDFLGFDYNSFVWSATPGYPADHKWDSAIIKYDHETGEYKETPLKDPIAYIMREIGKGNLRIGVEAANATGKSIAAIALAYWFFWRYESSRVLTIAPKENQLKLILWWAIKKYWRFFEKIFPEAERGVLSIEAKREIQTHRATRDDYRQIIGFTAGVGAMEDAATKAQGFHEENMLFLFDETPGIDPAVITAFVNTAVWDNNAILCVGNPDARSDQLHQFCILSSTTHIRISALDHPNIVTGNPIIPGAVTRRSILEKWERYGRDDNAPMYLSRVRGICPAGSIHGLFSQTAIAKAELAVVEKTAPHTIEIIDHQSATSEGSTKIYFKVQDNYYSRYLVFCDIAGDDMTGDWHAGIVWDRVDQKPVAVVHMRGLREDFAKEIVRVAELYKVDMGDGDYYYPMLGWETNGVGSLNLIDCVKKYPNPFHKRNIDVENASIHSTLGWSTNKETRPEMMYNLKSWGSELVFAPHRMVSEDILDECRSFVANMRKKGMGRFEAAPGRKDDLVMALAGAITIDKVYDDHPPIPLTKRMDSEEERNREEFLREQRKLEGVSVPMASHGTDALRNSRWTTRPSGISIIRT